MNEEFWQNAFNAIDCKISVEVEKWEKLLPKPVSSLPKFINLQKHLMHVIMSFLNQESQDGKVQELFIQIPVEEFANKRKNDNLQNETFRKIIATAASCAFLSTRDAIENDIFITNDNLNWISEGSLYFARHPKYGDKMLICEKAKRWPQIVINADRKRGQVSIPNDLKDGLILYYKNGTRPTFVKKQDLVECELFKLKGGSNRVVGKISEEINTLKETLALPKSRQYKNAKIVSIGTYFPKNDDIDYLIKSNYFDIVSFEKDIKKIDQNSKTDVIIVIGKDRYKNRDHQRFLRRASKKIIYIGSEMPFESVKENTYPLTFRELYRYCAPNDRFKFTEPAIIENIQFPWMDKTLTELGNLIDKLSGKDDNLEESRDDILECFRRIFSNLDFCPARWNKKKQNLDSILNNVVPGICSQETHDAIKNWVCKLNVPHTNAKANQTTANALKISRYDSYITKVKALRGYNNNIIIDCASYSPSIGYAMFQAYRDVISHHFFANVTALYYSHERNYANRLRWYLAKELGYYQNPLRVKYGTNVEVDVPQDNLPTSLDDIEFNWDEDLSTWWSSDNKTITLRFTDSSVANVDGDVLISIDDEFERISSSELKKSRHNGKCIYYYVQPDCFNNYKNAFELQEDVLKYSDKWKNAFRQYYDINDKNGLDRETIIQQIESKTKIKRSIFMKYLDERCTNQFMMNKGHMKRMCDFLQGCGLLSKDDTMYIGKAQKVHFTTGTALGKTIKEEAFLIKMCGLEDAECKTIPLIAERLGVSTVEIVNSCLRCGVIQEIEIIKN